MSSESKQLLIVVLMLTGIGIVFLFSASAVSSGAGKAADDAFFLKRQLLWAAVSLAGLAICRRVPVERWRSLAWPLFGVTIVLLGLVFVPGIGATINGARRWLRVGGFFVQPSEIAKLSLAILICSLATRDPERIKRFRDGFLPCFALIGLTAGMIVVEPDLGTAAFLGGVMTLTLIVAGARIVHLLPIAASAGVVIVGYAATHFDHVMHRINTWLHPDADPLGKGHQIRQSLVALGSGGWFGQGLGEGNGKLWYLPEVHSDFILPLVGQEAGFIGTLCVVLLFVALGVAGRRIMRGAATPFGSLLSFTLTLSIILQAAMNIAVVTASMPTKGIPLPFLSYGGSSLFVTMCGVGILMSIADGKESPAVTEREGTSCASSLPAAAPVAISSPA